jgi:hypothetical protein
MNHDSPHWRVWWNGTRGIQSIAGEFHRYSEAEKCIRQLKRHHPTASFRIEFTGKPIEHENNMYPKRSKH